MTADSHPPVDLRAWPSGAEPSHDGSGRLTADIPAVGGVIKERPEDFLVEEIPLYEPCGQGEHIYLFIEKRNMSALHLVRLLAQHFGVRREAVGVAGLKDRLAVTRQVVSVHTPGKTPADFPAVEHPDITVHWTDLHTNKLRRGHLKGNRFIIRIRGVSAGAVVRAHKVLARLTREGLPNRIGPQRFGALGNNHLVGRALMLGLHQEVLDLLLAPSPRSPPSHERGREAYAAGRFEEAMSVMPPAAHTERRVLAALMRGCKPRAAVGAIERVQRSFFASAFQSAIFNTVLDERLAAGAWATLREGDLAWKHDNGAAFAVDQATLADPTTSQRLSRLDISPTGPMWGAGMTRARGEVDEAELAALTRTGVGLADLEAIGRRDRSSGTDGTEGQRRPLRVPVTNPDIEGGADEHGEYVKCRFELPPGSFATVVMDEIIKPAAVQPIEDEDLPG